jgi:hypothetical protein
VTLTWGLAIQAAVAHGEEHLVMCQKELRARLFNSHEGLTVL